MTGLELTLEPDLGLGLLISGWVTGLNGSREAIIDNLLVIMFVRDRHVAGLVRVNGGGDREEAL